MRAGRMRYRVAIEKPIRVPETTGGGAEVTWTSIGLAWAEIVPLSERSLLWHAQIGSSVSHTVTLRYRADVTAQCRFNWGGRLLVINTVTDTDGRHRELVCQCTEREGSDGS